MKLVSRMGAFAAAIAIVAGFAASAWADNPFQPKQRSLKGVVQPVMQPPPRSPVLPPPRPRMPSIYRASQNDLAKMLSGARYVGETNGTDVYFNKSANCYLYQKTGKNDDSKIVLAHNRCYRNSIIRMRNGAQQAPQGRRRGRRRARH